MNSVDKNEYYLENYVVEYAKVTAQKAIKLYIQQKECRSTDNVDRHQI